MRFSAVIGLLLTMAVGTQAGLYCQCLYSDGSHCCIAVSILRPLRRKTKLTRITGQQR
ncbi:hypothetical protein CC77DRAFT_1018076 [Alternaria alternata]|uniref:Uncharacterized protein n=1 Tax=Alternaria alternata TaxID=5599 RepID=A0A177DVL2_ALTAL|nr:hypothetical protein CC77DRAFT_1018076 [Alternaria alternata]OAG23250.1 hypothetical protein CC77DRAFT_1018076 [Alternaria alternata]